MRIVALIASDEAVIEAVRAALDREDFVLVEGSVEAAMRRFLSVQPDAVIVDDAAGLGLTAIKRVRTAAIGAPLIALSNRADAETQARFALEGTRGFLGKPFACEQLVALVQAVGESVAAYSPPAHALPIASVSDPDAASPALASRSSGAARNALAQHRTALRWMGRAAGHMRDPDRLSQSLVEMLADTFDTHRAAVLMEDAGQVRLAASLGVPGDITAGLQPSPTNGLLACFERNPGLIDRGYLDGATVGPGADAALTEARREMQLLGMRLAAPLLCAGRVCGAVLTGDKASGHEYCFEERDLLTGLARSASIALENAGLYQRAARQESRLQVLLASIPVGVVVVGADRRIALMNRTAARALQVSETDLIGQSVQRLGSAFADVILRTLETGQAHLRHEITDPAIHARLGISTTPLEGSEAHAGGAAAVFSVLPEDSRDATEVNYSPFWEYLASRVAQEIKNPMVAISTFAQLLPRKYESEEFRESFGEVVQGEVNRINNVVETLFEFARTPRLVTQRTPLNEAVATAIETFAKELATRNIALDTHYADSEPLALLDPIFFAQALHNVVQNAIDAMPTGGALTLETVVIAGKGGKRGHCEVVVSDTGAGISEEDATQVFMPFFSTREKGMGLGLTLAHRILHQHGGELRLVPGKGAGTTFALCLPMPTDAATLPRTAQAPQPRPSVTA